MFFGLGCQLLWMAVEVYLIGRERVQAELWRWAKQVQRSTGAHHDKEPLPYPGSARGDRNHQNKKANCTRSTYVDVYLVVLVTSPDFGKFVTKLPLTPFPGERSGNLAIEIVADTPLEASLRASRAVSRSCVCCLRVENKASETANDNEEHEHKPLSLWLIAEKSSRAFIVGS